MSTTTEPETRTDVARRLDCSLAMVSRMLDGHRKPSLPMMAKIAEEYDIPLADLVQTNLAGAKPLAKLLNKRIPTLDVQ